MHARTWLAVAPLLALVGSACAGSEGSDGRGGELADRPSGSASEPSCEWPMFGQSPSRTFTQPCPTDLSPETVTGLTQAWFFNTDDVVTSTPAVVEGVVYVGDWSGQVYAIDLRTGEENWRFQGRTHPLVYSGQIVASPAVARVDDRPVVYIGVGKTLYALDASTGEPVWEVELGRPGDDADPTEIQSSPVVAGDRVIVGYDAHDRPGFRAGVLALDAGTGQVLWDFDPDQGDEPSGCAGVWSSPSVDAERDLVFVGTANCPTSPEGWIEYSEALVALDLDSGEPRWSFQPHEPNNNDFDFGGAPNLFEIEGRAVVGLGNKDGWYYTVDRETGDLVWEAEVTEPELEEGSNYSFGGFIGATAVADGVVTGGTAGQGVSACPCLHGRDAATGELLWQATEPLPIFGAAAVAGGVLYAGGTDFTFRAVDLQTGETLWSHEMTGVVAGGAAVVGNDVVAVVGLREPGTGSSAESAGVAHFTLTDGDDPDTPASTTSTAPVNVEPVTLATTDQPCVDEPCDFAFDFPPPPDGLAPTGTLLVTTEPFSIRIEADGLGDPSQWVAANAPDADRGADVFAAALSTSDEDPIGTFVCTFDAGGVCEGDTIPLLAPRYNRLSILALPGDGAFPSVAEGVARLVYSRAFRPVLEVVDPPVDE